MSKTFFLNFNQKNRDKFITIFSKSLKSGLKILDVGTGSSPYKYLFINQFYKTHDFQMLSPEQLLHKEGYGQIDYISDIVNIPVENASFDVIICTEVLEHVPEPINAIKEMSRILKPGGIILITAPLGSHIHQEPYHFYGGFTPYFYEKYLSENDFINIKIIPNQGFYNFYFQESLRFIKLSRKSLLGNLFLIISFPFILIFIAILLIFKNLLDKYLNDFKYTVGYHIQAIKN
jgi:ubiquinone/menaquinone biosynthesis C-methylase UbiE